MADGEPQLTIDGREVELAAVPSRRFPYTAAQRSILALIAQQGSITSTEAGKIVHAHRMPPCKRCNEGKCGYVASDGGDTLKRLQARGLVRRIVAGVWEAA